MDAEAKKTTLRMIPYGLYVLTADDGKGTVGAATVNWVTQTAFSPPLSPRVALPFSKPRSWFLAPRLYSRFW